jgi:uncharacterized protein (TIGR03083 family)
MQLERSETIQGMLAEYEQFADLVASLSDEEWNAPSRCEGWETRDVAGHVIGLAEDVAKGVPGSRTAEEEAADIRVKSPTDAAAGLRDTLEQLRVLGAALDNDEAWSSPSPAGMPISEGVLVLWYDTYVHADDIRAAAGRAPDRGPGLKASLMYLESELTNRKWGPASIDVTDLGETLQIGEGGPTFSVLAHDFVMAATGRIPASTIGLDDDVNIYAE